MTIIPFLILGCAICSVWVKSFKLMGVSWAPWIILYLAALLAGLFTDVLSLLCLPIIFVFAATVFLADGAKRKIWKHGFLILSMVLGLALSLHALPGFNNPKFVDQIHLSPDSASFTQYLNFDKATAGLFFLAVFSNKINDISTLKRVLSPTIVLSLITVAVVLFFALTVGYVGYSPKFSGLIIAILLINLLFTCVPEQAFFQGIIQQALIKSENYKHTMFAKCMPVVIPALLFGIAHVAGGLTFAALATLLGLGLALAYQKSRVVESPIFVHFSMNAIHIIGFAYPFVKS